MNKLRIERSPEPPVSSVLLLSATLIKEFLNNGMTKTEWEYLLRMLLIICGKSI